MGSIELLQIESPKVYNENILSEYKFVCNTNDIKKIYALFTDCNLLANNRKVYIYGYGSQPKSTYKKLAQNSVDKYDLMWYGYNGPPKFKLLSYITASFSGLLHIKEISCVSSIIDTLSHLSMVGLFSMSEEYAKDFENLILNSKGGLKDMPDDFIKRDKSFFYYVIDGDSYHSDEEGYFCQTGLGKECPDCLFKIIEFTEKRW